MDKRHGVRHSAGPAPRRSLGMRPLPFVGRDGELRRLSEALDRAVGGHGGTIFLTGQPGIGKTRLAREALVLAKKRGFMVLEGRAYPVEAGLAYAPIVDAVGPLLRSLDPFHLEVLISGLPDLGRLFNGLSLSTPVLPLEGLGDPALEKTRLFEAVLRLLERLAQESPLALFLDDVHWADTASLELLHYIARGLSGQRALLLATCSSDALDNTQSLRSVAVSLQRAGLAQEIAVPPLNPDAVEKLVHGVLGGDAPRGLLALLDARARGTPLFVEALITALVDSGKLVRSPSEKDGWNLDAEGATALPQSVRRLIIERLGRLKPAERQVLDLIAVMGESTSHAILGAASGLDEQTLLDALRRLRDGGLVAEEMDGSFQGKAGPDVVYNITHPLIQEVAYADLPEMARRRAHSAAIEAYNRWRPQDVHRLTRHFHGAGSEADPDSTLEAFLAAGDRALAVYANEEAARHFGAALALVREGGGWKVEGGEAPPSTLYPPPSTLPQVLEGLGEARERLGNIGGAVEVWSEALVLLSEPSVEGIVAAARLRRRLALAEWDRGHFDVANAHIGAGLLLLTEGLADHEPCQELADLHYTRCDIGKRIGDMAGAAASASELLRIAERLASPRARSQAELATASWCLWQGDLANAREHALLALGLSGQAQELGICWRAHATLVVIGIRTGDHRFIRYHAERGLAVAQALGVPHMEVVLRLDLAAASFMASAWDESLRWSTEAIALARRVGYPRNLAFALAERAIVLTLRADLPEAEACISEARAAIGVPSKEGPIGSSHLLGLVDIAETALAHERGQAEHALQIAKGFARSPVGADATAGLATALLPTGLMLLAEAQVAAGDPSSALETARELSGLAWSDAPYLTALASRAEGLARHSLSQPEAAVDCLARARELFTALAMPFDAARSWLEQAEIRGQRSGGCPAGADSSLVPRPLTAIRAAQQSLAMFERLGARRYADRARRLLRSLGASPPATRRAYLGGAFLSARELEIAQLVAQGLTSPEIAERLTIGPCTVSSHLRRIYIRLGIRSRTALARLVIEAGLL